MNVRPNTAAICVALATAALLLPANAFGHGGGLDSQGGHYDRKRGTYHYHRRVTQPRTVTLPPAQTKPAVENPTTEAEIKQVLIRQSISRYSGSCPCPYNTDRAGRSCGRRSAYSRPGGASPLCYASDVTPAMVAQYRERNNAAAPQ